MSSIDTVLEGQRAWVTATGCSIDACGYHASVSENLFQPLSSHAITAFSNGSGSETLDSELRPAKMRAIHSSAALAVNFFDYWTERSPGPLLSALGFGSDTATVEFEVQFPTGLVGIPPNLDIALRFSDGSVVGIESQFTEWLTPKAPEKELFNSKYFPDDRRLWATNRLRACQALAERVCAGEEVFRYLDVAQLLKHALGLSKQHPGQFQLYYLFFDCTGAESVIHRDEVERFTGLVGVECSFRSASYQEVYEAIRLVAGHEHPAYMAYLRGRYFPEHRDAPPGA